MEKLNSKYILGNDINRYSDPLEEDYYNSPIYKDFLENEHFHHTEKGCNVTMIVNRDKYSIEDRMAITKKCNTHNVICSKTGWELGWYMGTFSRDKVEYEYQTKKCFVCDNDILLKANNKYCDECRDKIKKLHYNYERFLKIYGKK